MISIDKPIVKVSGNDCLDVSGGNYKISLANLDVMIKPYQLEKYLNLMEIK